MRHGLALWPRAHTGNRRHLEKYGDVYNTVHRGTGGINKVNNAFAISFEQRGQLFPVLDVRVCVCVCGV